MKKDKNKKKESDDKSLTTFERLEQEYEIIKQRFLKSIKDEERKQINDLLDELEIPLTDNQLKRLEKQKKELIRN